MLATIPTDRRLERLRRLRRMRRGCIPLARLSLALAAVLVGWSIGFLGIASSQTVRDSLDDHVAEFKLNHANHEWRMNQIEVEQVAVRVGLKDNRAAISELQRYVYMGQGGLGVLALVIMILQIAQLVRLRQP